MNPFEWVREIVGAEEPCAYLPGRTARMRYRVVEGCTPETCERLLAAGWRRFGQVFFRPACAGCAACIALRVDVAGFAPSRSMRRTARAASDLVVRIARPGVDDERLDLYTRYHRAQAERRGWPDRGIDADAYARTFVAGCGTFGHELTFRAADRLLAVALVDILPGALSAVYTYYDPEQRHRGLGVSAVLQQVALARRLGTARLYLGYWIEANPSMRYKARYRPHELLEGRPEDDESPRWRRPEGAADES